MKISTFLGIGADLCALGILASFWVDQIDARGLAIMGMMFFIGKYICKELEKRDEQVQSRTNKENG